ncbi:MAG: zf-HC2 domain-containing protein [Gammaproteobacteria bacterium]|nr:zf-HC2 domain-containing protein [Gammaproteobacteria bacterium]
MINCAEASRLLSQAMERPLDRKERAMLRLHLLICRMCRKFDKQLAFMRKAMKQYTK